jgi:hypothetical protein
MSDRWETPDIRSLIEALRKRQEEQTVSGNAGAYPVPLGGPGKLLRRTADQYEVVPRRKKRK